MSWKLKLLEFYFTFPFKLGKLLGKNENELIMAFGKAYNANCKEYCLFDLRPKYSENVSVNDIETDTKQGEFAIIIQGQIKDQFTLETLRIYKKIFPKAVIIISTWDDTDAHTIHQLKNNGAHVVLSHLPENCGLSNVNYQIVSSLAGLKYADKLGAAFSFKTRSDQRIYNPNSFEFLKTVLERWPLEENKLNQACRIVTVSGFRYQMYVPYFLQDFLYFGMTKDLLKLFDIRHDNRNFHKRKDFMRSNGIDATTFQNCVNMEIPEIYIIRQYLKANGYDTSDTIEDYWKAVRDYFFIVDRNDLKLYWDKYDSFKEHINNVYYDGKITTKAEDMAWSFDKCIALINNHIIYEEKYENYMDRNI